MMVLSPPTFANYTRLSKLTVIMPGLWLRLPICLARAGELYLVLRRISLLIPSSVCRANIGLIETARLIVLPGFIKAGAPAFGQDPIDPNIFYYNGTPATMVFLALDYVLPKYANLSTVDLVLSGPNFGLNLGPFLYTIVSILQAETPLKLKA
jgi:hypothetical protein